MIWIIGLQRGCVGLDFEETVILKQMVVTMKLEGREMDSRDVKSGTWRGVFDNGVDNFDPKTENLCIQM